MPKPHNPHSWHAFQQTSARGAVLIPAGGQREQGFLEEGPYVEGTGSSRLGVQETGKWKDLGQKLQPAGHGNRAKRTGTAQPIVLVF